MKRISNIFTILLISLTLTSTAHSAPRQSVTWKNPASKIIVYYFHGEFRCHSCLRIEELLKKTLNSAFKNELKSGALLWKPLNKEEPQNKHFMKKFALTYNIAVIAEEKDGKIVTWKKLPGVWDHLNDENAFSKYVKDEISRFIAGKN